jgi:hypothetical protein
VQQEQARLRRNRDSDLIGQLQATAAFEVLLGKEDLQVLKKLRLILDRETAEHRHIPSNDRAPLGRNGLRA